MNELPDEILFVSQNTLYNLSKENDGLTMEQKATLDKLKDQQFQSSLTGRRIYGPRKLKLIQIFFGKLQQLERKGVNTRYLLKIVLGKKKGRRGYNTLESLTTKQISGLISQLKGF